MRWTRKAIKTVSVVHRQDGKLLIKEKLEAIVDHDGDVFHMVGWNGQTRTRVVKDRLQRRLDRIINNGDACNRSNQECSTPHPTKPLA